jgi:hypothetical protein
VQKGHIQQTGDFIFLVCRKKERFNNKQTNNINQAAAALYSTRKGKMSNVYLLVCPRLKEVCKTRIVRKFRARITYKVDKTELLFDHLLLSVVFDRDLLPLVLSAAASSSLLSSAVLNAPWPACEMCVCVRAWVCVSLSPSLVSSAIASAVPNLSLCSQPVSQQLLYRSLHYCNFFEDHHLCHRNLF